MPDSLGNTKRLLYTYGVRLENGTKAWTLRDAQSAYWAAYNLSGRLAGQNSSDEKRSEAFRGAFDTTSTNPLKLIRVKEFVYQGNTYTAGGVTRSSHRIELASLSVYPQIREGNIVHEFGHAYNQGHKVNMPQHYVDNRNAILVAGYQFNTTPTASETFADFMVAWTYDAWNNLEARSWMVDTMTGY